jgi:hypothetical protein
MPTLSPLHREELVSLTHAAAWVRDRSGRKTHVSTLHRWALRGCGGRRLETVLIGRQRMTSREALLRFFEATQPQEQPVPVAAAPPTSAPPADRSPGRDVAELHARLFDRRSSKAS